jgi:hypothetical protein
VTARAEEILYKAARWAGFQDIRFELEPVGATYHYHRTAPRRQTAFIFDFGGGTLDFTVAEVGGNQPPRLLATHGVLVGGDDLDRRMMQSLRKYFGAQPRGERELVPPHLLDLLDNWQTMPLLSRPDKLKLLDQLKTHCDPDAIALLRALVTRNLGFTLFRSIEQTKKRLSDQMVAPLEFRADPIAIRETFTRMQFERLIQKEIDQVEQGIYATLAKGGLTADRIDVVLRTGGSSAVPVFAALLTRIFEEAKLVQMDLLTSVVSGLAITAQGDGGRLPRCRVRYLGKEEPWIGRLRVPSGRPYELYSLRLGAKCYLDSVFALKRLPAELSGLPTLRTAQADKNRAASESLEFDLARPARVFVAYDATAPRLPAWLKDFTLHPLPIIVEQLGTERGMRLYFRDYAAGRVTLGGNRVEDQRGELLLNYFVILQAAL